MTEEFWQGLTASVQAVVKQSVRVGGDNQSQDQELVLAEVAAKTSIFVGLVEKVKSQIDAQSDEDLESEEGLESEDVEMTEE